MLSSINCSHNKPQPPFFGGQKADGIGGKGKVSTFLIKLKIESLIWMRLQPSLDETAAGFDSNLLVQVMEW